MDRITRYRKSFAIHFTVLIFKLGCTSLPKTIEKKRGFKNPNFSFDSQLSPFPCDSADSVDSFGTGWDQWSPI